MVDVVVVVNMIIVSERYFIIKETKDRKEKKEWMFIVEIYMWCQINK